uniref:Tetraspanin 14 n=1 Tax=Acanthochromis polyacanthus TaxID=80966 RepID=A0A3Q1F6T1_9TELE
EVKRDVRVGSNPDIQVVVRKRGGANIRIPKLISGYRRRERIFGSSPSVNVCVKTRVQVLCSQLVAVCSLPHWNPLRVLLQFSGVIGLIFFLELTAAVLAVVFQGPVREWINEFFLANIKAYRDDIDLQNLIDSLQRVNQCCGAQDPADWDLNMYFSCNGTHRSREKCGVPFSCCIMDPADSVVNTQCGYDVRSRLKKEWSNHIYTKGCITALEDWLPGNLYTVAIVFIVISLLQMVGIYLARTLISDIEKVRFSY